MKNVKVNVVFEIEVAEEANVVDIVDHVQKCFDGSNLNLWGDNVYWIDTTLKSIETVEELNYSM